MHRLSSPSVGPVFLILAFVGIFCNFGDAQTPPIPTGANLASDPSPSSIAAGDLNGDGRIDLAAACSGANAVSIFINNGLGGFLPKTTFSAGANPRCVAIGDLNLDGKLDIVTANNSAPGDVSVLLGNGAGAFGTPSNFVVGAGTSFYSPRFVAIGDWGGDGKPDLLTADFSHTIAYLKGDGSGAFAFLQIFELGAGSMPSSVVFSEFNGDGTLDFVVTKQNWNSATVFIGNGAGGGAATDFAVAAGPVHAAAGDLNNDGKVDIVTANTNSDNISVLINNGTGGFAGATDFTDGGPPVASGSTAVAIGEFNNDGKPDVACVTTGQNNQGNTVTTFEGNGNGGFAISHHYQLGLAPYSGVLADLNGDGRADIAAANQGSNDVSIYFGDGTGAFWSIPHVGMSTIGGLDNSSAAIGDFNGDGIPDIFSAGANNTTGGGVVSVTFESFGTGGGFFAPPFQPGVAATNCRSVMAADLNGDGALDIVTLTLLGEIGAWLGNGAGSFANSAQYSNYSYISAAVGDVNGDGRPDIEAAALVGSEKVTIFFGNGDGTFTGSGLYDSSMDSTALADVNGDGTQDIINTSVYANHVTFLMGIGNGSFYGVAHLNVGPGPGSAASGDLNGDGAPDIVTANYNDGTISVSMGIGNGSFATPSSVSSGGGNARSIIIGDLNSDGISDLATTHAAPNGLSILIGNGNGTFAPNLINCDLDPSYQFSRVAALADLNGDGYPDLVVACRAGSAAVLLNQSPKPAGISNYGTGTWGCAGMSGMSANGAPKVNSPGFALICTNAPRNSLGIGLVADAPDFAGSDPFYLNIKLHVDLLNAITLLSFDIYSDTGGSGFTSAPIPNNPSIVGQTFYGQCLWIENHIYGEDCSHGAYGLESSRGLIITIQP
ncbi:MAG: VCBS repeat-containing protein [Planctomycetes bacterium]|nr:VCBS repeat-containing protein [Planctomycetota bacterium]